MQLNTQFNPAIPMFGLKRPQVQFGAKAWTAQDAVDLKKGMQEGKVLFWDVDTQKGFMWPNVTKMVNGTQERIGLYVNGAEEIVPNLDRLTRLHERFNIPLVATMDSHSKNDPEYAIFKAVSDRHCEKGMEDWAKIPETTTNGVTGRHIEVSPRIKDVPDTRELQEVFSQGRPVILEKNTIAFNQFRTGRTPETQKIGENRKATQLVSNLKQLGINTVVVYGVATDFCVKMAVNALKNFGLKPVLVNDAIKGVYSNDLQDKTEDGVFPSNDAVYHDVTTASTANIVSVAADAHGFTGQRGQI